MKVNIPAMRRVYSLLPWLETMTKGPKRNPGFLEDEAEPSALLSRAPAIDSDEQPTMPRTFPEALQNGTAESKAAASILRTILRNKVNLDGPDWHWDWRFWDLDSLFFFEKVFARVCLFPLNEREAVMRDCIPLFERLEEVLSRTAEKHSRPSLSGDGSHYDEAGVHKAQKYYDKLKDVYMTRLSIVRGTLDGRLEEWQDQQDPLQVQVEEAEAPSSRPGLEWEERMRGKISVLNLKTYHDSDFKPYIPPAIEEAAEVPDLKTYHDSDFKAYIPPALDEAAEVLDLKTDHDDDFKPYIPPAIDEAAEESD